MQKLAYVQSYPPPEYTQASKNSPDLGSRGKKKKKRAAKNYVEEDDVEKVENIEWEKAVRLAQDREGWRDLVEA